ncbi:MarR family transcriptional regulator [Lactobacillus sp. CBA3605]|uniref:MarR family winged helix-turn-helix transcriptional regulator n=1 Tax=Lactobacillus sp. CBA3605 TaxID=2099788 RepID=UPI000CFDB03D|nr:MarR family winged helix-turn-helix transcriptional regulator [Lactobacillus sp. CBA3605]AVK60575.1 MarR family transcriptional regulator [Lactobacillus sp. CBA3605]
MQTQPSLASLIYQIAKLEEQQLSRQLKQWRINPEQARTLTYIHHHPGTNQRAVGDHLNRQAASTSNLLKGLSQRQLIERRSAPANDREKQLFLTVTGTALSQKIKLSFAALDQRVQGGLTTAQQTQLQAPLLQVMQALLEGTAD